MYGMHVALHSRLHPPTPCSNHCAPPPASTLQGTVRAHDNPMRLGFKGEVDSLMRQLAAAGPQQGRPPSAGQPQVQAAAGEPAARGSGGGGEGWVMEQGDRLPSCDLEGRCSQGLPGSAEQ